MSRSDPLLLLADIVQVASERPHLDPVLVQMLYRHLVSTRRRHTTIQQARDYIDDLTSRLDEETLWRSLGLAPPHNVSPPVPLTPGRDRQTEQGTRVTADSQTAGKSAGHDRAVPGPSQTGPISADRGGQLQERIGIERARSHGGSPPRGGLTRDGIIDDDIEHREPDATRPTPIAVSPEQAMGEGGRPTRHEVESDRLGYPTLQEIESKRRELADSGRPHGYDALGGKSMGAPFPGQRSTIRRRYQDAGLPPPGSWIPGVCDKAPRHPHPPSS